MADAGGVLSEALLRIEHKLDLLLGNMRVGGHRPMGFQGNICPVCLQPVDYQVDIQQQVVKRRCGCSSGKQPNLIPLVPVQGTTNGIFADPAGPERDPGSEDSPRRKGR